MTQPRPTYFVELDDGTEHRVEVLMGDQLRAELEAPKHGIPVDVAQAPAHTTALWCWSALVRTGVVKGPFQEVRARMVLVRKVNTDTEPGADNPVDPTAQDQPPASG